MVRVVHFGGCTGGASCRCEEKRYWGVLSLALAIFLMEIVGGHFIGSLSLQSDAFHVLIDASSIIVGIATVYAVRVAKVTDSAKIRRLGGDISAVLLAIAALWILAEAWERMNSPVEISSGWMIVVAAAGGIGNYVQHLVLEAGSESHGEHEGHEGHITHRAMSLHVLSDLWQSAAVVAGGIVIFFTGYTVVDAVLSVFVALYMFYGAANIFQITHRPSV